jgi:hypothetical protein
MDNLLRLHTYGMTARKTRARARATATARAKAKAKAKAMRGSFSSFRMTAKSSG